jgi:hypothetical protein
MLVSLSLTRSVCLYFRVVDVHGVYTQQNVQDVYCHVIKRYPYVLEIHFVYALMVYSYL